MSLSRILTLQQPGTTVNYPLWTKGLFWGQFYFLSICYLSDISFTSTTSHFIVMQVIYSCTFHLNPMKQTTSPYSIPIYCTLRTGCQPTFSNKAEAIISGIEHNKSQIHSLLVHLKSPAKNPGLTFDSLVLRIFLILLYLLIYSTNKKYITSTSVLNNYPDVCHRKLKLNFENWMWKYIELNIQWGSNIVSEKMK